MQQKAASTTELCSATRLTCSAGLRLPEKQVKLKITRLILAVQVQQTLLNSSACQEALGEARFKDSSGNYLNVDYRFASNAMICTAGELLTHVKGRKERVLYGCSKRPAVHR